MGQSLSRNALGTYAKRRITDENGSFSQLMTVRVNFVNTNSEVFIQEFSFLILPFFQPEYTVTMNVVPELDIKRDIPIVLNAVNYDLLAFVMCYYSMLC